MIQFKPILVSRFSKQQRTRYVQPFCCINLTISGLTYLRMPGAELKGPGVSLVIQAVGMFCDFEYTSKRENWVALIGTPHVRSGDAAGSVEICNDGTWLAMPMVTAVPDEDVPGLQVEFMKLSDAFASQLPCDQFYCQLGICNLLRYILQRQQRSDVLAATPAGRLKHLIDQSKGNKTLEELSRKCGYSPNHLRIKFQNEYGVSPLAYYNRSRMARALQLISNSQLTVKEIAVKTGFRHTSHFCTMFRQEFKQTPGEAIEKLRHI